MRILQFFEYNILEGFLPVFSHPPSNINQIGFPAAETVLSVTHDIFQQ